MTKRDKPVKDGVRTTAAEKERRLAFVEELIILGKAQSVEQVRGLLEQGLKVDVGEHCTRNYIAEAESRIGKTTDVIRTARREALWRMEMEALRVMFQRLKSKTVEPTWREFGEACERAFNRYCPRPSVEFEADEKPVAEADAPESKPDPELEKLVAEMLDVASQSQG